MIFINNQKENQTEKKKEKDKEKEIPSGKSTAIFGAEERSLATGFSRGFNSLPCICWV